MSKYKSKYETVGDTMSERCERLGQYLIETGGTVRSAAHEFGVSKSTVHKDVTDRLKNVNYSMYKNVKHVLTKNKSERHLRGGEATRKKYLASSHKI